MTSTMMSTPVLRRVALPAAGFAMLLAMVDIAAAQPRRVRAQAAAQARAEGAGADPAELARLFDAYTVMQAQEALDLDEAQFGPFVTRLRALQQLRRRHVRERALALRELRRLLPSPGNDAALKEKVDALARLENTIRTDEQKARDLIDEVLDIRQQARFRLLEQQLELRKLELVNRARTRLRAPRP
jgi:hypothetical protein